VNCRSYDPIPCCAAHIVEGRAARRGRELTTIETYLMNRTHPTRGGLEPLIAAFPASPRVQKGALVSVDAAAAKAGVDAAGEALASGGKDGGSGSAGDAPGTGSQGGSPREPEKKPDLKVKPDIIIEGCIGKECRPGPRRGGGSGVQIGPQVIPGKEGQPDSVVPRVSVPLPDFLQ
jgi:hypothetical protein